MSSSSHALIICSSLSLASCTVVVGSIAFDPTASKSRHLGLVFNLLLSGMGLSFVLIIYNIVALSNTSSEFMSQFCNVFFPFPIYFFLCSFGWTVLIAFKFRSSKSWFLPSENQVLVPFWTVWVGSFILVAPLILFDIARPQLINIASTTNMCVFDHSNTTGIIVDVCTFLFPLTLTILINFYSYTRGLWALRDSPHSVLAKNMRRAGGYLLVLMFVFIPNVIYNYFAMSAGTNSKYQDYLEFAFCLSSLQGFLNVIVYVYSNPDMKTWILLILCCKKPWERRGESSMSSADGTGYDVEAVVSKSPMFNNNSSNSTLSNNRMVNTNLSKEEMIDRDSFTDPDPSPLQRPLQPNGAAAPQTKGILQSNKAPKNWNVSNLDQEKFVRFGEVTTRYISEAERASMSSINALSADVSAATVASAAGDDDEFHGRYREMDDPYRDEY